MTQPRSTPGAEAGQAAQTDARFERLLAAVREYRPQDDLGLLRRAYDFSARQHETQRRASGEPYLSHPVEVAHLLAEMRLDVTTLCAGLLHDVIEDTGADRLALEEQFGNHVAGLVDGVSKISRLEFSRSEAAQAENLRKMLLAMVDDVRVILIKLADRLHNMRTLEHLPVGKRRRVAQETLDIYAPIAHRLGMGRIRGELEDLAFSHLEPEQHGRIGRELEKRRSLNHKFLETVRGELAAELEKNGVPAEVEGRIKRRFSIHQKMLRQGIDLDQVYDLLAVRVITDTVRNCYGALGVIHQLWRPVPGRFKDYVAMARSNLYQSLHTSVISPAGQSFEVQIRTDEMHRVAEHGIAAHWSYKEEAEVSSDDQQRIEWLRSLIDWARETEDPSEFLSTLKVDLYPEEVYAFTPKGKVLVLPREATAVDFAYEIHTEVGHQCAGARVNGRLVPLRHRLQNGDIVEILTQERHKPSRDWLGFVRTSRARNKIRQWIRAEQRTQARELGRRLLERDARRFRVELKKVTGEKWQSAVHEFGCQRVEDIYAGIGFGKFATRTVLSRISREPLPDRRAPLRRGPVSGLRRTVERMFRLRDRGVSLEGQDLLMYRAGCCNPIPGEDVIGYITRGRGIAVHGRNCANVESLLYDVERRIEVEWAQESEGIYPVRLAIRAVDRPGLLKEISGIISDLECNIRSAEARTDRAGGHSVIDLIFTVTGQKKMDRIVTALKRLQGVHDVSRVLRV